MKKELITLTWLFLSTMILSAQTGNVGVGTQTPLAKFHINGDMVATDSFKFVNPDSPPVSGAGTRLMWYGDKAAFRVGHVDNSQWDMDSIGDYSFAAGYNGKASGRSSVGLGSDVVASGDWSTALGNDAVASGDFSTALGIITAASGNFSTALGHLTTASGAWSTTLGHLTKASAFYSTALGYSTLASGDYSTTLGCSTTASGAWATALGSFTTASGNASMAIGRYTKSNGFAGTVIGMFNDTLMAPQNGVTDDTPLFIVGNGSASSPSNAVLVRKDGKVGIGVNTPGTRLHLSGGLVAEEIVNTINPEDPPVSGAGTRMMWYPGKAAFRVGTVTGSQWDKSQTGFYSVALGYNSKASGNYSTALGSYTNALGMRSTALGQSSTASGFASIAMGDYTSAFGSRSTAMGTETIANGYASTVIGMYNDSLLSAQTSDTDETPLFIVGNGNNQNERSNAMVVRKDGKVGIGTNTPGSVISNAVLQVGGGHVVVPNNFGVLSENSSGTGIGAGFDTGPLDQLYFYAGGNNHVTMLSTGYMGIGTTSPEKHLHIIGPGNAGAGILLESTNSDGADLAWETNTSQSWVIDQNNDPPVLRFATNGTGGYQVRMSLSEDGKLGIKRTATSNILEVDGNASKATAGDWLANSDARLKMNIRSMESEDILEKLLALRGVHFEWQDTVTGYTRPAGEQYGMIAQEVQQVFPELVTTDAEGYLQMAYGTYDPMYIEAIRALNNRIGSLEKENKVLYQRLEQMENRLEKFENRSE